MTIAQQLAKMLDIIGKRGGIENPDKKYANGARLFSIYVWQELKRYAEKCHDLAWEMAQRDGVILNDDALREIRGERILITTPHFSLIVRVDAPRQTLDRDLFISELASTYNLNMPELFEIADRCKVEGKAVLHKRVVEKEDKA